MEVNNDFSYKTMNKSTLKFYKSYIYGDYNITRRRKLRIKDDMMFASETSLQMVCTYIMGVAVTHLLPGTPNSNHPAQHSCSIAGSKLLAKHVSDVNDGIKVYPVNPAFVMSTGLKESEMPSIIYPEGIYVKEVPGLSSAGVVDALVENIGYIVFVRGGKNNKSNDDDDNIDATDKINKDSDHKDMPDL
eukprot:9779153-Ditylum_brightwellii.AAC.1